MSETTPHEPLPAKPVIPGELFEAAGLIAWIEGESDGEPCVAHVRVAGETCADEDFELLELSESRVENCLYVGCTFDRATFTDVAFSHCDFSNSSFTEANFTRCTFSSCKLTGADFTEAVLARIEVRDSTFAYASLVKAKLSDVRIAATDFSYADLAEVRQKRTVFDDVRFAGTSFFRASLAGIDFSSCQLSDIVLSDAMDELRGCSMDLFQAAGIARRLGVTIKD